MKLFKLPDRVYDVMKWLDVIFIPALTALYVGLCSIYDAPFFAYPEQVAKTSAYVCTFLGVILGISTVEYNKGKKEEE